VTVACADLVVSARLVALTVTCIAATILAGALYNPLVDIVPTAEFPPATPFTFQVTPTFAAPLTAEVNC
jgi:hypothetical protein